MGPNQARMFHVELFLLIPTLARRIRDQDSKNKKETRMA
jgi:hypothetical protein